MRSHFQRVLCIKDKMIGYLLWAYRALFYCRRNVLNFFFQEETDEPVHRVDVSDIPWLWVGGVSADDVGYTVTNEVNRSIDYGTHVTPAYLESVTGIPDIVSWKYLDPVELEEKEFPSEGFLIEHATPEDNKVSDSGYSPESD